MGAFERTPLKVGAKIFHGEDAVEIVQYAAKGGSCLVYYGTQDGFPVIVKEFYTSELDIPRDESGALVISISNSVAFEALKDDFLMGQGRQRNFYSRQWHSQRAHCMPPAKEIWEFNNTVYAISDPGLGNVLAEIDGSRLSLYTVSKIMISVSAAIDSLHRHRRLYLDIKPGNFFYYSGTEGENIYLCDFDTIVDEATLRGHKYKYPSASAGWAAPEQRLSKETNDYTNPELVSYSTDMFGIGCVFLWLLTGIKNPTDGEIISEINGGFFNWREKINVTGNLNEKALELIDDIARNLLGSDRVERKEFFGKAEHRGNYIIKWFENLSSIDFGDPEAHKSLYEVTENAGNQTRETIGRRAAELKEEIQRNSVKQVLFGSRKKKFAFAAVVLAVLLCIGGISVFSGIFANKISGNTVNYEADFDSHLLMSLSNANHQYEVGLENWRRLDYTRAERDIKAARDEISESVSQSEIDVASINNSLGCLYLDMGRYEEAYDYLNAAYVTFKDKYGVDSAEARSVLFSIAQYEYYVGDIDTAKMTAQQIIDASDAKKDVVILTSVNHFKAMIEEDLGNYAEALTIYEETLSLYSEFISNDKLTQELVNYVNDSAMDKSQKEYYTNALKRIILTYASMGEVYIKEGKCAEAKDILESALDISLDNIYIGTKNLVTARLYMDLALATAGLNEITDALDDVDLAMRIEKNLFDFEGVYPGLVEVYDIYGNILTEQGKTDEAIEYYMDALTLAVSSFGENHPQTASACNCLGVYYLSEDVASAVECFTRAIDIQKNMLSKNHPDTISYYINLAAAQIELGDYTAAEESLEEAENICSKLGITANFNDQINSLKESIR